MIDNIKLIDSHVHVYNLEDIQSIESTRSKIGADKMGIVSTYSQKFVNRNPVAMAAKVAYPGHFYMLAGLDHTSHFTSGKVATPSFAEQVDMLIAIGADGIKMLEAKPDERKDFGIPLDNDYYAGLFARLEETKFPLVFHVADPEEFWDPATTPAWAREQGWGYNSTFTPKEKIYEEVLNVLARHPNLNVAFAHFFLPLSRFAAVIGIV